MVASGTTQSRTGLGRSGVRVYSRHAMSNLGNVSDGLSLLVVERGHPFDDEAGQGQFERATVAWLGYSPGVEWLHDEANRRFGREVGGWFRVESERHSGHFGAAGEFARLMVEFLGAGVAGKLVSDFIDDAKEHIREWRDQFGPGFDPPPDLLARYEVDDLLDRLRGELAGVLGVPAARIEALSERVETTMVVETTFRDTESGARYHVEVDATRVVFTKERE
jgi:hypothetical protein